MPWTILRQLSSASPSVSPFRTVAHGRNQRLWSAFLTSITLLPRIDDAGFGAEFQAARKAPIALKDACYNTGQ